MKVIFFLVDCRLCETFAEYARESSLVRFLLVVIIYMTHYLEIESP